MTEPPTSDDTKHDAAPRLPAFRPDMSVSSGVRGSLKRALTGARAVSTDRIKQVTTTNFGREVFTPVPQSSLLSVPYAVGDEYLVKVLTRRNLALHRWTARWRNLVCRDIGIPGMFASHDSQHELAHYEFSALQTTFGEGAYVPEPVEYAETARAGIVVLKQLGEITPLSTSNLDANIFVQSLQSLCVLHEHGFVHGDIPTNIVIRGAADLPCITAPMGRAVENPASDTAYDTYMRAYDVAALMAEFTPSLGSWAVADHVAREYSADTLALIPRVAWLLPSTQTRYDQWVIEQIVQAVEGLFENDHEALDSTTDIHRDS